VLFRSVSRTEVMCVGCDVKFMALTYEIKRGNGKFCSSKCSRATQAKINASNMKSDLTLSERRLLWKERTPIEVHKAHNIVQVSIENGSLIRMPCEVCGAVNKIDAHHDDYSKPLNVRWLCRKHHLEHHRKLTAIPALSIVGA